MKAHRFECHLAWTGAAKGTMESYAAYSRDLSVSVEGKPDLAMSAATAFRGDASRHDPEVLLVASLSACHCLSYLALAAAAGIRVVSYEDRAEGRMENDGSGYRFAEVLLRPRVRLAEGTDRERAQRLHDRAHEECFIARSVNFPVHHEAELV